MKSRDDRTQRPTIQEYSDLTDAVKGFGGEFVNANQRRDPFGDTIWLSQIESRLEQLAAALNCDRSAFQEAERAVEGAEAELRTANQLVASSINDRIPDSRTISQCQEEVTTLEIELTAIGKRLNLAHGDWGKANHDANQLNSKLGIINGRMRQELGLAQQAVQILSEASQAVYDAANWRGSFRIAIVGNPGSGELDQARRMLNAGTYAESIEFGNSAQFAASNAIERAMQQVEQHRRKLAREADAARRRRESLASSFAIGSSMSNHGSSSRSTFGSSFGSGSTSHRSSSPSSSSSSSSSRSSGFSRSKW